MGKRRKVHKYRNDDPTETWTACGIWFCTGMYKTLIVDADARKTTCDNCQRTHAAWYKSQPDGTIPEAPGE